MNGRISLAVVFRILLNGGFISELIKNGKKRAEYSVHVHQGFGGHVGHITIKDFMELLNADVIERTGDRTDKYGNIVVTYILNVKEGTNGWSSSEECLPTNDDEMVLVTTTGKVQENITLLGAYFLATYSKEDGWILEGFEHWDGFNVTYWRELPPPPDGRRKTIKDLNENGGQK